MKLKLSLIFSFPIIIVLGFNIQFKTSFDQAIPSNLNSGLNNDNVLKITMGENHSALLSQNGEVFTWGSNISGQLGDGTTTNRFTPNSIKSFKLEPSDKIIDIALGGNHSSVLTQNGKVFMWGNNGHGQLGNGTKNQQNIPINISNNFSLEPGDKIVDISLGQNHSAALSKDGEVFTWGDNRYFQLGDGEWLDDDPTLPINISENFVELTEDDQINQIELGYNHSSAMSQNGEVFTWGKNEYGQIGNESIEDVRYPINIIEYFGNSFPPGDEIIKTSLGANHSSATTKRGQVFMWGNNIHGQLGDGNESGNISFKPINIANEFILDEDDQIIEVSLGSNHSSAISQDGEVFTWGSNIHGQLGIGEISLVETVPINITSNIKDAGLIENDQIISISLGGNHSSTISQDGEIFIWGQNDNGQVGNDDQQGSTESSPVHISKPISNLISIKNVVHLETTEEDIKYKYEFDVMTENNENIQLLDTRGNPTNFLITPEGELYEKGEEVIFVTQIVDNEPKPQNVIEFNYLASGNIFFPTYETLSLVVSEEVNLKQPFSSHMDIINPTTLKSQYTIGSNPFLVRVVDDVKYQIIYYNQDKQIETHYPKEILKDENSTREISLNQNVYNIKEVTITINYNSILQLNPIGVPLDEFITNYDDLLTKIENLKSSDLGLILGLSIGLALLLIIGILVYLKWDDIKAYHDQQQKNRDLKKANKTK